MIALWIMLGVVTFLLLLLLLPVRLSVRYADGQWRVRAGYAFVMIQLLPAKEKKPRKPRSEKPKKEKPGKPPRPSLIKQVAEKDGVGGVLSLFGEIARLALTAVKKVFAITTLSRLRVRLAVGAPEAADAALLYGKLCAGVYPAFAVMNGLFHIKRPQLDIKPDFSRQTVAADVDIRARIIPLRLLPVALWALLHVSALNGQE